MLIVNCHDTGRRRAESVFEDSGGNQLGFVHVFCEVLLGDADEYAQ